MVADPAVPDDDQTLISLGPLLRRVLAERGVPASELDDITQDCMVRLLHARRRLTPASLVAYAVVVARNAATSHIRAAARHRQHLHRLVDMRIPPEPSDHAVHLEEQAALAAALAQLDPADRSTLLAHELDGASTAELADAAGATPAGVAARLARTRSRARVEYLLALTRAQVPNEQCKPVLISLSAGDQRRQARLDSGAHLLDCQTCAAIAPALVERRRGDLALLPLLVAGRAARRLGQLARGHPAGAATGAAVAIATAVTVAALAGQSSAPPITTIDQLAAATAHTPPHTLLIARAGRSLPATAVTVAALAGKPGASGQPDDEQFWVGGQPGRRILALGAVNQEVPFAVTPGRAYTFTATITALPADRTQLDIGPGAQREVQAAGYYLRITDVATFHPVRAP